MEEYVMKKSVMFVLCILMGMLFVVSIAVAGTTPGTGITAGPHDLSSNGQGVAYGDTAENANLKRICVYCHAPHNTMSKDQAASMQITYFPLWNHDTTVANYTMYTNGTDMPSNTSHQSQAMAYLQAANSTRPGSVSRLCLSCHDGTVSTNAYGAYNGASSKGLDNKNIATAVAGQLQYLIGGTNGIDLSNHHPIGFPYANASSVDNEIAQPTAAMGSKGLKIGDLLWNNNMECTTCHDVHNSKNEGEKFLWASDASSAFCKTCHLK
jgi:predicted CXXCH cytochrome family protein